MKMTNKILSVLLVTISIMSFSQVSFGLRGNLLFKSDKPTLADLQTTATNVFQQKGDKLGFNIGLSAKIETPTSFFIMPELYYTTFQSEFTETNTNTTVTIKSNRVDLPVLVGYNLVGKYLGIYAGPVASYNLSTDNQWNDFKENASKQFTMGYQFGAQAKISKLVVNARYEGAFTNDQKDLINSNTSQKIRYDNRPSLFIVGLGFDF